MKLEDIIVTLNVVQVSNEEYYNLSELSHFLHSLQQSTIEMPDCLLMPYYISDHKRMEFYDYELRIDNIPFEESLLLSTGVDDIKSLPLSIVEKRRSCHIKLNGKNHLVEISKVINYINYLYQSTEIQEAAQRYWGAFSPTKLYFAFYT